MWNIYRPPDAYNDVLRNLVDHDKGHDGNYVYLIVFLCFVLMLNITPLCEITGHMASHFLLFL